VDCLVLLAVDSALDQESSVTREEMDALKTKLERLEKTIEDQNARVSESQAERHWYDRIDMGLTAGGVIQGSSGADDDGADATGRYELELTHNILSNSALYFHLKVNEYLNVSPDIQWMKNPDGDKDNDDTWARGLRAQLSS